MARYVAASIIGGILGVAGTFVTEWIKTPDHVVKFREKEPFCFSALQNLWCADALAKHLLIVRNTAVPSDWEKQDPRPNEVPYSVRVWYQLLEYLHNMTLQWQMRRVPEVNPDILAINICYDKNVILRILTFLYTQFPNANPGFAEACEFIELVVTQLEGDAVKNPRSPTPRDEQ